MLDREAISRHSSGMSTSTNGTVKAVTYLRVSGAAQIDGDGFPRQREVCAAYASANGIEIAGEYRDEACSGCTDADAREAFGQMIERIAGNGVRLVLVERADRLARDLIVSETLLATLRKLGVRVIEACSGIELTDASDPSRILVRQVLGAVAEFNRRELVGKLAKARKRIRDAGLRCEGVRLYGSRPGESAGLDRILDLVHGERLSFRKAAATLNAEGIPSRSGKPWTAGTVQSVVVRAASRLDGTRMNSDERIDEIRQRSREASARYRARRRSQASGTR
jgi:DNA invertase Pin-like site-specific DNA recombinase